MLYAVCTAYAGGIRQACLPYRESEAIYKASLPYRQASLPYIWPHSFFKAGKLALYPLELLLYCVHCICCVYGSSLPAHLL
jgi:hypothetical protein